MSLIGSMAMGPASALRFASTRGRMQGGFPGSGVSYPSPFFDIAHTYLPATVKAMFRWCRYYFLTNPLINSTVFKLSEYPITDIIIDHENPEVASRWQDFFQDHFRYRGFQVEVGLDYHCLAGDTPVVTAEGILPIRELAGRTVSVLSEGGVYREAHFRSYGTQRLWEVHTDDGVLLATEEHEWPVFDHNKKAIVKRKTKDLTKRRIPRTVASRPPQNDEFWEGVRHGIVFGDGTVSNGGKQGHVILHPPEKRVLARYFEGHCSAITPHPEEKYLGVYGLPPEWKKAPAADSSASYWYGFTCGLLSTDGSVDCRGDTCLTQKDPMILLEISKRLPWLGMLGGQVREHWAWNSFTKQQEPMSYLSLKKQWLQAQDFIRPDQRAGFEKHWKETSYGRFALVSKVVPTNRVEEVFCCVEPETHTFVIGNGLLTGNCYGNSLISLGFPFHKYLYCASCDFREAAFRIRDRWVFTNYNFRLTCPRCGNIGDAIAKDFYFRNASGIKLIRWNAEDVDITYNDISGEYTHFYTLPGGVRNDIVVGKKDVVESAPQLYIQALREQKSIILSKSNCFHMRRPGLATIDRGWGTPLLLPLLKDAFYLTIMKKSQEAVLLEHMIPLRVLYPQPSTGSSDPYTSINLVDWRDHVAHEIARWRGDQNYIPILPLPIGHQAIGGDGKALLLTPEIQMWSEQMVIGMGVPREFVFGGAGWSGTNVSMRMVENGFIGYMIRHMALIKFIMQSVAGFMGWPMANIRFKPFKMADDLQRKAYRFQLNQAGKLSDTTLLADDDLDQSKENEIMIKESDTRLEATKKQQLAMAQIQGEAQLVMMKYQAKAQQTAQQAMTAGAAPGEPGGMDAQAGGSPGGQQAEGAAQMAPESLQLPQNASGGVPAESQSQLNAGQRMALPNGAPSVNVDITQMAQSQAKLIANMDPKMQQLAVANLQSMSPDLCDLVIQILATMGVSVQKPGQPDPAMGPQVDQRPLPEARAPRRETPSV